LLDELPDDVLDDAVPLELLPLVPPVVPLAQGFPLAPRSVQVDSGQLVPSVEYQLPQPFNW
jgi:hypothetical protein